MLEPRLDLYGLLQKPFRRRKTSFFESVNGMVKLRHDFIHRGEVHLEFGDDALERAIADLQSTIDRAYAHLASLHHWHHAPPRRRRKLQMWWIDPPKEGA